MSIKLDEAGKDVKKNSMTDKNIEATGRSNWHKKIFNNTRCPKSGYSKTERLEVCFLDNGHAASPLA